jgi:hypothetical protein
MLSGGLSGPGTGLQLLGFRLYPLLYGQLQANYKVENQ